MRKIGTVQIDHAGRKWSGSWEIEGREVVLSSAYGSDRQPLGRRDPVKLAERLLKEIVKARA